MIKEAATIDALKDVFSFVKREFIEKSIPVSLKIEKLSEGVSYEQLKYYWGAIIPMSLEYLKETEHESYATYSINDLDQLFRAFFYTQVLQTPKGPVTTVKSLKFTKADMKQVSAYFDQIIITMAKKGLVIPSAEEYNG